MRNLECTLLVLVLLPHSGAPLSQDLLFGNLLSEPRRLGLKPDDKNTEGGVKWKEKTGFSPLQICLSFTFWHLHITCKYYLLFAFLCLFSLTDPLVKLKQKCLITQTADFLFLKNIMLLVLVQHSSYGAEH